MPRFVILRHEVPASFARESHWDLMLEQSTHLMTWSLRDLPQPLGTVAAEALAPHRKIYLDYEGLVSGDRGHVRQWDAGEFHWLEQHTDQVVVRLEGRHVRGTVQLCRRGTTESDWELSYTPEEIVERSSIDESTADG